MTKTVILCRRPHKRHVFHLHECRCVKRARSADTERGVPITDTDGLRLCHYCEWNMRRDYSEPNRTHTDQDYGGTLSSDNFYPDCVDCGAAGALHVDRWTPNAAAKDLRADWECHRCGSLFTTPHSSPWAGVWDIDDDLATAHIEINIRGADPREVASAQRVDAESLVERANRAVEELAAGQPVVGD